MQNSIILKQFCQMKTIIYSQDTWFEIIFLLMRTITFFEIHALLNPTVSAFQHERFYTATFGTIQSCILNISIHRESWRITHLYSLLCVQT